MRRRRFLVLVIAFCVTVSALLAGVRTNPVAARAVLSGLGVAPGRAAAIISCLGGEMAAVPIQPVRGSGILEGETVAVVSEAEGRVVRRFVDEGVEVQARQVLVQLDTSLLLAQKAGAEAALASAEAALATVRAGTHPGERLVAQAGLEQALAQQLAAQVALQGAQAILDNPQQLDLEIVKAASKVELAEVEVETARALVAEAQVRRDQYRAQGSMQEKGAYAVYDYQLRAADANLQASLAALTGARQDLEALRDLRDHPLASISQVHLAESGLALAEAGVAVAQARLDETMAGPRVEDVQVAEAHVAKAAAAVAGVQVQIEQRTLTSPISGVVTGCSISEGEVAIAGARLLTIADLSEILLVVYVEEGQLGRVYVGQGVEVHADAFPGELFLGHVVHVAQQAEFTPKNVQTEQERLAMVFSVKIRLPNPDGRLRPGMPADVTFQSPAH